MSETPDRKEPALIPTGSTVLTTRSSALAKRGLETIASLRGRIVRFPPDRSMGKLWIYSSRDKVDQWTDAARGDLTVPPGKKLVLSVSDEAINDLSPLASLRPDDLQGLIIWPSKVNLLDEDLVYITRLKFLEALELITCDQLTDLALAHIGELTALRELRLTTPQITDDGLVHLENLTNLEMLWLMRCNSITNNGLGRIVALKNLRHLHLDGTLINGAGLSYLHQLTLLTGLGISNAEIFDADVAQHIRGLTNLRNLSLGGTHITDDALSYLRRLTSLKYLNLASCEITDSGLVHLQSLIALELLDLSHTNISQTAIDSLQEALPNCRIIKSEANE
jgi:Leucine-rich repeat (LRR) protein